MLSLLHATPLNVNYLTAFDTVSCISCVLIRWLSVRLESLGAFATLLTAIVAVEQRGSSVDSSTMGLLLSYTMQITLITNMTLRVASLAEMSFNAGAPWGGAVGGWVDG